MAIALLLSIAGSVLAAVAHANCANAQWSVAYSPERCSMVGNAALVSCNGPSGSSCGTRMSSNFKVGAGAHTMTIKAAPGAGVATTYYLSNNGGLYDKAKTKPWVELDYEIMGAQAGGHSRIWTNMFTGIAVEHWKMITVPFDTSADYHTYEFRVSDTKIAWVVDGVTYREEVVTPFHDVVDSVHHSSFQEFLSVWAKSSHDQGEGIPEFRQALGVLDSNKNNFPLYAGYIRPAGTFLP